MSLRKYLILFFVFIAYLCVYSQENEQDPGTPKNYNIKLQEVEFQFNGTQTFDESLLEGIISIPKSDGFLTSEFYTDSKRIQKFYFDNGFLDAKVDTSSRMGDDSTKIIAIFNISEKERYRINRVIYNGIENVTSDMHSLLSANTILREGKHYNKTDVQLEISRILTLLVNNGYALAQADVPDIVKFISKDSTLTNKVDIILNFTPRSKFNFGKTSITLINNIYDIEANDLRRELQYSEGEVYSKEKLVSSENRISKIAIFENGRIQIDKIDSVKQIIDLKINAIVTNKYELKPEIFGFDIDGRFYGGAGLTFINKYFFGGGRVFTAGVKALLHDFDYYRYEGLMTLYQPHLFDNDKITGTDNFGITSQNKADINDQRYNITSVKNLASMKYELRSFTYFNNLLLDWKLGNERLSYYDNLLVITPENDTLLKLNQPVINIFTSSIGFSLIHNQVDNLQFPTTGSYAAYSFEETGLLGLLVKSLFNTSTSSYFKLTTQNKVFWDISKENTGTSVLGTKIIIGNIFQYGDNKYLVDTINIDDQLVPNESNFTIGGSATLRGWRAGRLAANVDPEIGGGFIIDGSFEHRTKPFAKSKNTLIRDLGFASFLDYGNIWDSYKSFRLDHIALAVGAGIRYYTIVGAFRFDLGFKLYDPGAPEKQWLFQNDIGTIFKSGEKMQIQFGIGNTF
ncbi:MAG: BamA/TamA family outer membrane protein [Bacteroidetes bacterium]|nr:BamA/TamA family outer membrane protein [Bacteroidota bacterium]